MLKRSVLSIIAVVVATSPIAAQQGVDAYLAMARQYIAKVTMPGAPWTGPTTGPKAVAKKLIVYVSSDQRNGGPQGAAFERRS